MPPLSVNEAATDVMFTVRCETLCRAEDPQPVIKASVHDALWMLTQQWRVGEFKGEDAASIVKAKIETKSTQLNRFKSRNGPVRPFSKDVPLEAEVEKLPLQLTLGIQLEAGYQWYKILSNYSLASNTLDDVYGVFIDAFPIKSTFVDENDAPDIQSNTTSMQIRKLMGSKLMNGGDFIKHIYIYGLDAKSATGISAAYGTSINADLDAAEAEFVAWMTRTYHLPEPNPTDPDAHPVDYSWSEKHLEYQFSLSAPLGTTSGANQMVFRADKYNTGNLDWYSVDLEPSASVKLQEVVDTEHPAISNDVIDDPVVVSYLPHTIYYKGMTKGRWWEFEDKNIDIARMLTQKQDISKLILLEFGLIYSNDWFVFPHRLENGTIADVTGLVVTDVFGRKFIINRAGAGEDDDWQRWAMFFVNKKGITDDKSFNKLFVAPNLLNRMESEPLEKVAFLRDEMANMAWGVEEVIPDDLFSGMSGKNAVDDLLEFLKGTYTPGPPHNDYNTNNTLFRYKLSNAIPENWIPFVPAAVDGTTSDHNNRAIRMQRAALVRYLDDNYTSVPITPRTQLLSHGLYESEPYFVNEEEFTNAGFVLTTNYQRTRWYDGRTYTWLGRKKRTGRGEGNSGFKFDMLVDKAPGT